MNNEFLSKVESLNNEYCSIWIDSHLESLALPFWSLSEIESGLKLRGEWEVPENLIPFQGDWHDLICLDEETGEIVNINDQREVVFVWSNTKEFFESLSTKEIVIDSKPKVVSVRLNPELLAKLDKSEE